MSSIEQSGNSTKEYSIDFIDVMKSIWSKRKFILILGGVFCIVGILVAITTPSEYLAKTRLLPERESSGNDRFAGNFGGLAGLVGIDLKGASNNDALPPTLYPQLIQSIPFLEELSLDSIRVSSLSQGKVTIKDYFSEHITASPFQVVVNKVLKFPSYIKALFGKKKAEDIVLSDGVGEEEIYSLTSDEYDMLMALKSRIWVEIDQINRLLVISAEMPDALAAADLLLRAKERLTENATNYKLKKIRRDYEFIHSRYLRSKENFSKWQLKLATFEDENQNMNSSRAQTQRQNIRNEYNLAFDVYKALSEQLEQSKIEIEKETPIFTVLDPIQVPIERNRPDRKKMVIVFFAIGIVIGIGVQLLIFIYSFLKKSQVFVS